VRGRPHEVGGRAVWATYHPSAAIRFGPAGAPRAGLAADLAAVAAALGTAP
jgi:DNA polymerase